MTKWNGGEANNSAAHANNPLNCQAFCRPPLVTTTPIDSTAFWDFVICAFFRHSSFLIRHSSECVVPPKTRNGRPVEFDLGWPNLEFRAFPDASFHQSSIRLGQLRLSCSPV